MKVIEKIVFGGDVLINERVYSVQLVMMNVECDFNGLVGVVYRFEGLYWMMNFFWVFFVSSYSFLFGFVVS